MVTITPRKSSITLEEFLNIPETKPYCEYIDGNIEQKPMPQGEHSIIQTFLSTAINQVGKSQKTALAFTELRCNFGGRSLIPDISIFTWERIPRTEQGRIANHFNIYPNWVIEILSPEQSANKVIKKIMFCLNQGTELAWLIDSKDESVIIFKPKQFPDMKSDEEILPTLKGVQALQLSVKEMFGWLEIG
jgi:Uma2 family endonuclease